MTEMNVKQAWLVRNLHMDSWSGNEIEYRIFRDKDTRDSYVIETNKDLGKGAVPEYYVRAEIPQKNNGQVIVESELFCSIPENRGLTINANQYYA